MPEHDRRANPTLRLAVSGIFLEHPQTGTGRYAHHVVDYLQREPGFCTSVIADDRAAVRAAWYRSDGGRVPQTLAAPMPSLRPGSHQRKLVWEQAALPLAAARVGADVLYAPHFSAPLLASCPTVVSVHDVIPLADPAYAESLPAKLYFRLVGTAARRAAAVITLSDYARTEIVRLLGIDPARIHVVSPGVEAAFDPRPDPDASRRARDRYGLPGRYLLYVGGADARKNIGILLEAMSAIPDAARVARLVVVAGRPKPDQEHLFPNWRARAVQLGLGERVHFVERVAEEDLPAVYREALAFVFPSRAEGFGLTPLEAMACGTPVISSNATSLPEAVGDAGILVRPDDAQGWAEAIGRVCDAADLRARLVLAGLDRARRFQWHDTGAKVSEVIRRVARCAS